MTEKRMPISIANSKEEKCPTKKSQGEESFITTKKKATFVCVMCEAKFISHSALKSHFRNHGAQKIDLRGRPTEQSTLLKFPSTIKSNTIQCEYCSAVFPNISRALQHKFKKHRTMKNSFCDFCGKLFPLKCLLEQHVQKFHFEEWRRNNNDKKGQSKEFTKEATNELKYGCALCTATFVTMEALNFHIATHAASYDVLMPPIFVPPPSTKIKLNNASEAHSVYYCHLCGLEYILKHNLRKHIKDAHTAEGMRTMTEEIIRCHTCNALFYNQKAYKTHLTYHSPDDWHVSSEEQRGKVVSKVDQDFDVRRVPTREEFVRNIVNRSCGQILKKPSTSVGKKILIPSDDESMSPPSTPSDSEDEANVKSREKVTNNTLRSGKGIRGKINRKKSISTNIVVSMKMT